MKIIDVGNMTDEEFEQMKSEIQRFALGVKNFIKTQLELNEELLQACEKLGERLSIIERRMNL